SGLLIALSQLRHILGIEASGKTLPEMAIALATHLGEVNPVTLIIGAAATAFLFWVRRGLKPALQRLGLG
ncbi:MAG: SulP family inorganic anion transporter, partial [Gammaproteobacteria bacterium]